MTEVRIVSRTIVVRTSFVGWHNWPEASGTRRYLRDPHRHRFEVEVEMPVGHNDREVEFHDLLALIQVWAPGADDTAAGGRQLGRMSCEDIAHHYATVIATVWPRPVTVAVFEDGEAGARLSFDPYTEGG